MAQRCANCLTSFDAIHIVEVIVVFCLGLAVDAVVLACLGLLIGINVVGSCFRHACGRLISMTWSVFPFLFLRFVFVFVLFFFFPMFLFFPCNGFPPPIGRLHVVRRGGVGSSFFSLLRCACHW